MKPLMLSGAVLLAASGAPMAQTPTPASADTAPAVVAKDNNPPATVPDAAPIPAFRASDFTSKTLYVLSLDVVTQLRGTATHDECTTRWTSGETFIAGRKRWDDIGAINDPIMTRDGQLRGVLLDIGGFLGIGARTVMVDMADLYFVADSTTPDDLDDLFAIASLSREQLEALPEWREENLAMGYPSGSDAMPATDGAAALPTAKELTGAEVQDATGASIGTIGDLVLEGDRLAGARIDVAEEPGARRLDVKRTGPRSTPLPCPWTAPPATSWAISTT